MSAASAPMPFSEYMRAALYGPTGFYMAGGAAGQRGDFLTSPSVGPLFGAVVARFVDVEWERVGRPDPFVVVDAGAGRGALARAIRLAGPACAAATRLVAVEVSPAQRRHHDDGLESVAELPDGPYDGVIIANELLDNLPFRLAVHDDGWREAFVDAEPGAPGAPTRYVERLSTRFDPVPRVLPASAALGARAPLQDEARRWVEDARGRLRSGTVVAIDYMSPTTAMLAARPWRDWLRTYRGHARGEHYLAAFGQQDITAEVAVDQLPEPDATRTQAQWLQLHGIDELVAEGKHYWSEHAAQPDLTALRMRSRISEAGALLDPAGLGAFTVLEWRCGV